MTQEHKISLLTATIITINSMIGAGIFSVPIQLVTHAGPAGLVTYACVSAIIILLALTLSRVAQEYPESGSFYHYASQWGGHEIGLFAAGCYITGLVIALGLLTGMAGTYLHTFIPALSPKILSLILLGAITFANSFAIHSAQWVQYLLSCCTLVPIILTTLWCFAHADLQNITPFMPYSFFQTIAVAKAIVFGFFGFESAASLFAIVKKPEQTVPKAITRSVIFVSTLSILFIGSLMLAIPAHDFAYAAENNLPLTTVLGPLFKNYSWMLSLITLSITTALLGVLYSMIFSCSRLVASLSSKCKQKRYHLMPASSVYLMSGCVLFCFLTLTSINLFFSLTALFIITAFMLSIIPLVLKKKNLITSLCALLATGALCGLALYGVAEELNKKFVLHYDRKECKII